MAVDWEVLRKAERGLGEAIYHLTWAGELWGPSGAIRLSKIRFRILRVLNRHDAALSALSSTYYTASGNAAARAAHARGLRKPALYLRAAWYLWRAVRLSDRLERMLGLEGMHPDQLDVRQSILRKARRHRAALRCIQEALWRENVRPHTRALLQVGRGEILERLGRRPDAAEAYQRAGKLAAGLGATDPQRMRIERDVGYYLARHGAPRGMELLKAARRSAEELQLYDQVAKIDALLKRLERRGG